MCTVVAVEVGCRRASAGTRPGTAQLPYIQHTPAYCSCKPGPSGCASLLCACVPDCRDCPMGHHTPKGTTTLKHTTTTAAAAQPTPYGDYHTQRAALPSAQGRCSSMALLLVQCAQCCRESVGCCKQSIRDELLLQWLPCSLCTTPSKGVGCMPGVNAPQHVPRGTCFIVMRTTCMHLESLIGLQYA